LVVFLPASFKTLRMLEWVGLKKIKEIRSGPLVVVFFCENINANLQMPTNLNLKNDFISSRVRQCPFKVKATFQNLFIYKIISHVFYIKSPKLA